MLNLKYINVQFSQSYRIRQVVARTIVVWEAYLQTFLTVICKQTTTTQLKLYRITKIYENKLYLYSLSSAYLIVSFTK